MTFLPTKQCVRNIWTQHTYPSVYHLQMHKNCQLPKNYICNRYVVTFYLSTKIRFFHIWSYDLLDRSSSYSFSFEKDFPSVSIASTPIGQDTHVNTCPHPFRALTGKSLIWSMEYRCRHKKNTRTPRRYYSLVSFMIHTYSSTSGLKGEQ